ncbi:cytochrome P450, family 94, subfamily C, polypeptide 1 [Hibiscus trionum]|uniref:Cytochrome P450, family 94, subfamily C, polypeptide 1 n=1 Tax=Hibiscus trionum TaxID=183268 RepID=A0A9W7HC59_HIBTR|nr:cytochrome P450, family 94, subfamily C, polypeptide 1 [Hibiscus trionum]
MDSDSSSLCFCSVCSVFSFIFFSFTLLFSLFSLLIFVLRLKLWCKCEICQAFLDSSWTKDFDNLCDWYTHLLKKSPTGSIRIHVLGNIVTADPENVEHILKTRFENYPKGEPFSALLGDLLGQGIFNVDGDSWMFQRKMASLELGSVSIRIHAFDIVESEIRSRLIPLLSSVSGKQRVLDLQDVFRRFSFDNICKFSFGFDPGCLELSLPVSEFAEAFDLASKLSAQRGLAPLSLIWKAKRVLNLGSEKELKQAITLVDDFAQRMINQRREMGFSDKHDLLSRFMGTIDDDKYLRDIVVSFILAGRDTVASGLTCFFWLISQHLKVESAIREELERVMSVSSSDGRQFVTFDQMREMHYLHAAVCESLRLFPPVQYDSKFALDDDVLPDCTFVRKGTRVTYHPYAMGRMERVWGSDCHEFNPERWLINGRYIPENPFKYPVFQAGLRVCLGKEMALVEMKCVVLAIISRFNIRVADPDRKPRFAPGLTATVRGGLPILVQEKGA